ncbi:MAG: hypothetical protein RLZZ174_920 [Pseudomonadota bacterium]|jgi:small multidrug resistance pump|nr:multidrug efflux SMR transporter [Pseudomonadales bacterium]MBL6808871.1 multidrug efflux SMR transporter [Pseudomonadales bacterium]MDA0954896.1 SMR family transporter [Pseudomonadota bacterium]
MVKAYLALALSIAFEVLATANVQLSAQFTRLGPTLIMAGGYLAALYFMSIALAALPIALVYATWSGVGIVAITLIGRLTFGQVLTTPALLGIGLIVAGVVLVNGFGTRG